MQNTNSSLICVVDRFGTVVATSASSGGLAGFAGLKVGQRFADWSAFSATMRKKLESAIAHAFEGKQQLVEAAGDIAETIAFEPMLHSRDVVERVAVIVIPPPLAEKRLADSLQLLVEGVKDYAIYMLNPVGYIETWNSGAERIKGYQTSEVLGKHFSMFYSPADREAGRPEHNLREAARTGRIEDEGIRLRKDGTEFFADVIITALRTPTGELCGFAKVTRDVTERYQLSVARDEALRASQAKSTFLANMSHELRTPLNAIVGYGELLEEELEERGLRQLSSDIKKILGSSKHLLSIINNVLDLSRIESGQFRLDEEELCIGDLLVELAEFFRPLANLNRNTIVADVPDGLPLILADRTRLRQILYNLLSNANKFTSDGHIRISAESVGHHPHQRLLIHVEDTGIGISPEELEKVFDRFYQVQSPDWHTGTGLGLAISKLFCDAMGGSMSVKSALGVGSCFTVNLAMKIPDDRSELELGQGA